MKKLIEKLSVFFVNIKAEFKKIIWPKREELAKQTLIVIVICLMFGLMIFAMDTGLSAVLKLVAGVI